MSEETQEFIEEAADSSHSPDDDQEDYGEGVDTEDDESEPEQEEEDEELDVGDKKLRVPKSVAEVLKSERLMHADYTRKTQEVADQRKAFEAQQAQHQEQVKSHQTHLKEVATIMGIDERIGQYEQVDWGALSDEDPIGAPKHYMQYQQLLKSRADAVQKLQEAEQKTAFDTQQSKAKQLEDAHSVLVRDIKGWSPEVATKLHDFAIKDLGFTPQEMGQVSDPRIVKLLHQAYLGAELAKKSTPKAVVKPAVKPATVVSNNASPVKKDPSKMNDREFAAWRAAQIKNRR